MVKVAFTGSFDPPHEGHKYVVDFCKNLGFDITVVVANNIDKVYSTPWSKRLKLASDYFGVKCLGIDSENIGHHLKQLGFQCLVRGVRNINDFHYEEGITEFNISVNELNTIYIPARHNLRHLSSTYIRQQNALVSKQVQEKDKQ